MDISSVPVLSDFLKEYYSEEELINLSQLFDVGVPVSGPDVDYDKLANVLVVQIEHGNNRRFLESVVPRLIARCREKIAKTNWEEKAYHLTMEQSISQLRTLIGEPKIQSEISVPEDQPFTAKSSIREFLSNAETDITVVDPYIGPGTLDCLRDSDKPIRLLTSNRDRSIAKGFERSLSEFQDEGFKIEVRQHSRLHDRYLIFNDRCWLIGSSLKDAGKKTFNVIEVVDSKQHLVNEVLAKWGEASILSVEAKEKSR